MTTQRDAKYPGRWGAADADYPLGIPKNRTTPTSADGSYFARDWIADYEAFFGKLMTDAGITANNTPDTAQASQIYDAFVAALSVENRLKSNQNFNVAGADGQINATPQTFTVGQEFAKGCFVTGTDLVNATHDNGLISADGGSYYREYEGDFTGDFYGIKLADDSIVKTGVTISLEGGNTRLTVDMSVAPAHKFVGLSEQVGTWTDVNNEDSENAFVSTTSKRIEDSNGAAAFDLSGVLWVTDDVATYPAIGAGWNKAVLSNDERLITAAVSYSPSTTVPTEFSSVNVSSVIKLGAGLQRITFATPMINTGYVMTHGCARTVGDMNANVTIVDKQLTYIDVKSGAPNSTTGPGLDDFNYIDLMFLGGVN